MDSRMHSQRQRGRLRAPRAFSPPQQQQHQFVQQQQLQHAASSRFHPHQQQQQQHHVSPLQHRPSLVDDHFHRAAPSGAGGHLEPCDFAPFLGFRPRINGLLSTHLPEMVPHLARGHNGGWPQAQRLQGFRPSENRLGFSDEYGRQGSQFERDYRETRDDLRSLSELDNSRRSAALSAKIFLDDVRPHFESAPAIGLNRHHFDREETVPCDSIFAKGSQRLVEESLRKRTREEETDIDSRERIIRQRRFHDPGFATLPKTPETSRDFPLVQRILSSGRFVDGRVEDRQAGRNFSGQSNDLLERHEFYRSPSKSAKKKLRAQHKKASSAFQHSNPHILSRLGEPKDKPTSPSDFTKTRLWTKKSNDKQFLRDSKQGRDSPKTSSFGKKSILPGADNMNQLDQHNRTDVNTSDDSHRVDVCGQATPGKVLEVDDQNPEKRLSATSLASAHTEVRADESTSRSKNVDIRVTRSSSSDAKACESASKHMQREQESDTDMALELQIMKGASSFKESMHQDTGSSHGEGIQETHFGAIMKQEQHLSTDINKSVHAAAIIKLTLPSHVQCHQNSSDCKNKSFIDTNVLQLGQQVKEQDLISHEAVIPHLPPKDLGHSYWFVSSVASGDPAPSIASGICSPPLRLAVHEQAMNDENSVHSLLSLSVNADGEVGTSHKNVEDYPSTLSCESSMFDLAFLGPEAYRKTLVTPLSEASRETPGLNTSETASECEVRLFGQSLKAPVAKMSLDTQHQVNRLDASINNTKPNLPRSKLVSDQETSLISSCSMVLEPDLDPSNHILGNLVSKCNVAVVGSCEKGEDIPITAPNNVSVVVAESIANVVNEVQAIRPESPKEPPESMHSISFDNVLPDPSPVSAVRVVEQETMLVNKMIEKSSDEQAHIPLSEITAPRLASYRKDTVLTEVSVDMVEQVSNLNVTANQGATKVLSAREDQAEAVVEQEGRPEISAEMSNSYVSSKKVSLFQQGISQKTPGRAGPNTWHRATGNLNVRQVSSKPVVDKQPPKVVSQKVSEGAAYVRKGNSLVRAPVSSIVASSQSLHLGCSIGKDLAGMGSTILSKATQGYPGFRNVVRNTARSAFRQAFSIHNAAAQEMIAKVGSNYKPTATMLAQEVSHDRQLLGSRPAMLVTPEGHSSISSVAKTAVAEETTPPLVASEVARDEPAVTAQTKSMPLSGQSVTVASKMPDSGTRLYVKSKANQLIAALPMKVSQSTPCNVKTSSQDAYYKRNKNQLVRNVSEANRNGVENPVTGKKAQEVFPLLFEKEFRKRAYLPSSKVWTLKEGSSSQVKSVLPLLFPWKRPSIGLTTYVRRYKALPKAKKGSLLFLISKKLQRLRKVQPVYSRSAGGFSLHRSGLFSLNGANLKWTKSIEKRSKKASKEATMAVAAVEKQKRKEKAAVEGTGGVAKSKVQRRLARQGSHGRGRVVTIGLARYKMDSSGRTLQRLPDQWCANAKSTESAILSTPRRLSYDGTEYVRIGNGHKLVRDPKAAARALASEKVRWSIHTARSRWAKKQQYCLFFTRFGKCNKSERDCPYIHDPEKIAVCRKFLKGTCSETNCLFSHKVIPERMPDCSFFLEGMCTNEECPYRHVNVNPKAPICDGFLKGFCSEGDECNKKHTTVCPTFLATGECADRAACKLHHPRKKHKRPPNNHLWKVKNKKRRYFVMEENMYSGQQSDEQCLQDTSPAIADRNTEFIEVPDVIIDSEENGEFDRMFAPFKANIQIPQDSLQGNTDLLIKPVMLLQRSVSC